MSFCFPKKGFSNAETHSKQKIEYSTVHGQGSSGGQMKVLGLYFNRNRLASRVISTRHNLYGDHCNMDLSILGIEFAHTIWLVHTPGSADTTLFAAIKYGGPSVH